PIQGSSLVQIGQGSVAVSPGTMGGDVTQFDTWSRSGSSVKSGRTGKAPNGPQQRKAAALLSRGKRANRPGISPAAWLTLGRRIDPAQLFQARCRPNAVKDCLQGADIRKLANLRQQL